MKDLLLREFEPRSALVVKDSTPKKPRFPLIDGHNHLGYWDHAIVEDTTPGWTVKDVPAMLSVMDEMGVQAVVNLDGGWGDLLRRNLERYKEPYPDRFAVFAWVDWAKIDEPNFGEKWARELQSSVQAGAQGLKIFKELGLGYRDKAGKLISPDDARLDPIWAKAGELGIPIVIHSADPVAFFEPLDEHNERWEELYEHPDWHFYGKDYPPFIQLIEAQLRVVERHPETNFISAHIMCYAENLAYVGQALDRYPNLYVDMAERVGELGRQPYAARNFFIKYADRIVFGTDCPPKKAIYQLNARFLETDDEYFAYGRNQGRWRAYGLYLPDDVLRKVYSDNARRLIPGLG